MTHTHPLGNEHGPYHILGWSMTHIHMDKSMTHIHMDKNMNYIMNMAGTHTQTHSKHTHCTQTISNARSLI